MTEFYEIDFLEAGEKGSGDAIALRIREEGDVDYIHVVDGGYTSDGEKIAEHIRKYYNDPTTIDHVVLTHPDGDHAAGLKYILEEFEVSNLWMNRPWQHVDLLLPRFDYNYTRDGLIQRLKRDFPNTKELEEIAESRGIPINDAFQGSNIGHFTILAPTLDRYIDLIVESDKTPEPERKALVEGTVFTRIFKAATMLLSRWGEENLKGNSEGTSSENESSIVQYSLLRESKILLTGDAGVEALEEAYQYAITTGIQLPGIDRFDVPHHGSRRNVSSEILDKWLGSKLSAQTDSSTHTAIISANQNDEEHPKKATVRALVHRGAKVIQTNGTVRTSSNAPDREGWSAATPLEYPSDQEE